MAKPHATQFDHAAAVTAACTASGGASALAKKLDVGVSAISNWRVSGIPAARVGRIAALTGLQVGDLRPDLFPAEASAR